MTPEEKMGGRMTEPVTNQRPTAPKMNTVGVFFLRVEPKRGGGLSAQLPPFHSHCSLFFVPNPTRQPDTSVEATVAWSQASGRRAERPSTLTTWFPCAFER